MMRKSLLLGVALAAFSLSNGAFAADAKITVPAGVAAAVSDAGRPDADKARDAGRHPGESVAFAGIKAGDKVADLLPGGGYFTRIFAKTVGDKGKVYAINPEPRQPPSPEMQQRADAFKAAMAAGYPNVTILSANLAELKVPEPLDVAWTSLNYHDLKNNPNLDIAAFNKAVLAALKPGGTFIVIDHAAEKGSGGRDTGTLHRIDAELVKKEVTAAGFVLDGSSDVLAQPGDNHSGKVFDADMRGKTDQFLLKFKKPGK
jgi:predicted methyltransferase